MADSKHTPPELYDVIEVGIAAPNPVRVLARSKVERIAESIVDMAVMRRGVENHFYKLVPAGQYNDGDSLRTES